MEVRVNLVCCPRAVELFAYCDVKVQLSQTVKSLFLDQQFSFAHFSPRKKDFESTQIFRKNRREFLLTRAMI